MEKEKRAKPKSYAMEHEPTQFFVSDYTVPYVTQKQYNHNLAYGSNYQSPLAKLGAIKQGLEAGAINELLNVSGATQIDLAKWLDITEPTLRKHIQSGKGLNPSISEHIIQLFELFNKGIDTFGSLPEFKGWLKSYNLGVDATPFDMLDTITGIGIVLNELIRIDHGVTA